MTVPDGGEPGPEEAALAVSLDSALATFATEMDAMRFRPAAFALRSLWTLGNQYLDRCAPWHETDTARVACILRTAINVARIEAIVSAPFVPFACERLAAVARPHGRRALVAGRGERGIADARPRPHPGARRSAVSANRRPEHAGRLGRGDGAALRRIHVA